MKEACKQETGRTSQDELLQVGSSLLSAVELPKPKGKTFSTAEYCKNECFACQLFCSFNDHGCFHNYSHTFLSQQKNKYCTIKLSFNSLDFFGRNRQSTFFM